MSNKNLTKILSGSTLALSLVLTGCIGSSNKKDATTGKTEGKSTDALAESAKKSGPILCSIDGKPAIYESDFIKSINQMMQQNPYFRGAYIDALPGKLKRQLLDKLTDQELILAKAYANKINETDEFKTACKDMMQLIERSFAIQFFEKSIYDKIEISNEKVEKYFNENKDRYVKVAGGTLASGAKFANDADATKFMESIKANPSEFDKHAKENKQAKFKHFERVTQTAQGLEPESIPEQVKTAILAAKSFPRVEKVTISKDNVWVVAEFNKQEPIYFALDEIKKQVEDLIKNNEFGKAIEDQLKELRKNMTVDINEDYFKDAQPEPQAHDNSTDAHDVALVETNDTEVTAENNSPATAA